MTLEELLAFFEGYYGEKYSGVFRDTVTAYLDGCSAEYYKAAAKVIVKRFSRSFNRVPDVAEFEKNRIEIIMAIPRPMLLPEPDMSVTPEEAIKNLEEIKGMLGKIKLKMRGVK